MKPRDTPVVFGVTEYGFDHLFAFSVQLLNLIITPEPVSRTLLFSRVAGPYQYLNAAIDKTYEHAGRRVARAA